jgi:hypothetical protein
VKASLKVFTATQALTKRSNVIPVEAPYPVDGAEALSAKTKSLPQNYFINSMGLTVFVLEKGQEARWQPVSEIPEGLRQLVSVNRTGSIPVKVPENTLPVGYVLPKSRELY